MHIFSLNPADYCNIDPRLRPFLTGWTLVEQYKGKTVTIPGTWKSEIFPYRYFEAIKKPGDDNYDPNEAENEICLCLWAGWKGYDDEADIRVWITGKDVLDKTKTRVSAEVFKTGGAPMKLYRNGKLLTDFRLLFVPLDKVWLWRVDP